MQLVLVDPQGLLEQVEVDLVLVAGQLVLQATRVSQEHHLHGRASMTQMKLMKSMISLVIIWVRPL